MTPKASDPTPTKKTVLAQFRKMRTEHSDSFWISMAGSMAVAVASGGAFVDFVRGRPIPWTTGFLGLMGYVIILVAMIGLAAQKQRQLRERLEVLEARPWR